MQDLDRKNEQTAIILKRQADQILELEALYKEEQILRKRYFNMMEGKFILCDELDCACHLLANLVHIFCAFW